jgi:hypothetical protein
MAMTSDLDDRETPAGLSAPCAHGRDNAAVTAPERPCTQPQRDSDPRLLLEREMTSAASRWGLATFRCHLFH